MSDVLGNFRASYHTLHHRVCIVLRTQVGARQALQQQRDEVLRLQVATEQVCLVIIHDNTFVELTL